MMLTPKMYTFFSVLAVLLICINVVVNETAGWYLLGMSNGIAFVLFIIAVAAPLPPKDLGD